MHRRAYALVLETHSYGLTPKSSPKSKGQRAPLTVMAAVDHEALVTTLD